MKIDIKNRWTEALRSGKYQQGQTYLQCHGKFCCLGVLCDLAAKEGIVDAQLDNGIVCYGEATTILPTEVMNWAGMRTPGGHYGVAHEDTVLWMDNDDRNLTFEQIADIIDQNAHKL